MIQHRYVLSKTPAAEAQQAERVEMILALLEERPYQTAELAEMLAVHNGIASMVCQKLARDGRVVRLTDWRWTLPGPTIVARAPRREQLTRVKRPPLTPIANVHVVVEAEPVAAAPLGSVGTTRIIDGIEFEVVFDGRGSLVGEAAGLGSTLSGDHFVVRAGK